MQPLGLILKISMKKQLIFLIILFSTFLLKAQQNERTFLFETDSFLLTQNHIDILELTLKDKDLKEIKNIIIEGYTDTVGSKNYNLLLSEKRANSLKKYFINHGVLSNIIKTSSFGESNPVSTNNLSENRRVKVKFYFTNNLIKGEETDIKDFYKSTKLKSQEFCIDNTRDTIITCEKGTIIYIKANSFQLNEKHKLNSQCIIFQVKEVFLKSEMILENLTTTSNGQILESQSMIYTNAMMGDDTLQLQNDIVIMTPTDKAYQGMKMFDGHRDPQTDIINWSLDNNSVLKNFSLKQVNDCGLYRNFLGMGCDSCCTLYLKRDTIGWRNCWLDWYPPIDKLDKCKFFFCKIKRFITNTFNKKSKNDFRKVKQRNKLRKLIMNANNNLLFSSTGMNNLIMKSGLLKEEVDSIEISKINEITESMNKSDELIRNGFDVEVIGKCGDIDSLFASYGVNNINDLVLALNKPLMDEIGVSTMQELLDTLPKINMEKIEIAYRNKSLSYDDFKYYIFNTSKLGWKNCDIFADIKEKDKTEIKIDIKPEKTIDCKLVFKNRSSVLPAKINKDFFSFSGIPKKEKAWIVGVKYENGIPYLALKEIEIKEGSYSIDFKQMSLDKLKEELKVLDFE